MTSGKYPKNYLKISPVDAVFGRIIGVVGNLVQELCSGGAEIIKNKFISGCRDA